MSKEQKQKKNNSYDTVEDVILRLQSLQEERGNLPIRVRLPGMREKPLVRGIRYAVSENDSGLRESIEIVPKYDVMGGANKLAGANSIINTMGNIQTLFVIYGKSMMSVKALLEDFSRRGVKGMYNGRMVEVVPSLKSDFTRLYDIAKAIRDNVKTLSDFNDTMKKVIGEPILDNDYVATFDHHIDMEMTDCEFAKLITKGVGEKTSVQRLAILQDVLKKINAEITNRRHRISALEKRMKTDAVSNEAANAQMLKSKMESIVKTLMKRKEYVISRYTALKESILKNIAGMDAENEQLLGEHSDFETFRKPRKRRNNA